MSKALKRLFIILFPLSLLALAMFLQNLDQKPFSKPYALSKKPVKKPTFTKDDFCPFYFGFSFFSIDKKAKQKDVNPAITFQTKFLYKSHFLKKLQNISQEFQKHNTSLKHALFVLPIVLTKNNQWIISKKSFFFLKNGERQEISYMSYLDIKKHLDFFTKSQNLKLISLSEVLDHLPSENVLFYIEGSRRNKIIKHLQKLLKKIKIKKIYISSSNARLLQDILALKTPLKILHSFKHFIKFQIMKTFLLKSWVSIPGKGFLIPSVFSSFISDSDQFKKHNKLFFLQKDPPYDIFHKNLIKKTNAVISSKAKLDLNILKYKNSCFISK